MRRRYLNPLRSDPVKKRLPFFDKHLIAEFNRSAAAKPSQSVSRPDRRRRETRSNGANSRQRPRQSPRVQDKLESNRHNSEPARTDSHPPQTHLSTLHTPFASMQELQQDQPGHWEAAPPKTTARSYQVQVPTEYHERPNLPGYAASVIQPQHPLPVVSSNTSNVHGQLVEVGPPMLPVVGEFANYLAAQESVPPLSFPTVVSPTPMPCFHLSVPQFRTGRWVPVHIDVGREYSAIRPSLANSLAAQQHPMAPVRAFDEITGPPPTHYVTGISLTAHLPREIGLVNQVFLVLPNDDYDFELYVGSNLMNALRTEVLRYIPSYPTV